MNNVDLLKNNNVDVSAALELWGDMDSYNESLREFKNSLASKLTNLENYKNANDWDNYAILAHSIKSESKYLGFMKDAEVFLNHELKSKEKDAEFIRLNFPKMKETIQKITTLLNEYFGEKKNLLIADDSNIILNFLEKAIHEEYNILRANNGAEAISLISSNQIYAILLDLNMPGMNGFEVLDYLKERDLMTTIPVIVITGDDTSSTIQKAFSYPILDVLNKPFNEKNIQSTLESIHNFYQNK